MMFHEYLQLHSMDVKTIALFQSVIFVPFSNVISLIFLSDLQPYSTESDDRSMVVLAQRIG